MTDSNNIAPTIDPKYILDEKDLKTLDVLMNTLETQVTYHSGPFSQAEHDLIIKLLHWPTSNILPVLDAFKVLMCHSNANAAISISTSPEIMKMFFRHSNPNQPQVTANHTAIALKALGNWVGKRAKSAGERADPATVPADVMACIMQCLDQYAECVSHKEEKVRSAYAMFAYNVINWYGRLNIKQLGDQEENEVFMVVATAVLEILNNSFSSSQNSSESKGGSDKLFFYALLTVGSAIFASSATKEILLSGFSDEISQLIRRAQYRSDALAIQQLGFDLAKVIARK
jgi:hypothetical protein